MRSARLPQKTKLFDVELVGSALEVLSLGDYSRPRFPFDSEERLEEVAVGCCTIRRD